MLVSNPSAPRLPLHIGCPVWNCDAWAEKVYPVGTNRRDWLRWYSRMFNTVEGNNSFYAIPTVENAEKWVANTADGFQFCMKFPRQITHDLQLVNAQEPTNRFIDMLRVLQAGGRLGPTFLQLGPTFSPAQFNHLASYLQNLPTDLPWAVEVRHPDWFDTSTNETRLDNLLRSLGVDKVLFDSRALYQKPPDDEIEKISQTRKPKTPLRHTATSGKPLVRLVGRNQIALTDAFFDQWIPVIADWLARGLRPYIFTHAPDDTFAPDLARRCWQRFAAAVNHRASGTSVDPESSTSENSSSSTSTTDQLVLEGNAEYENKASTDRMLPSQLPELPKKPKQLDLF